MQSAILPTRYAVRITIYDHNANILERDRKLFRLRRQAEDFAKNLKEQHNVKKIISYIEVIKISENRVVENYKTKRMRKLK